MVRLAAAAAAVLVCAYVYSCVCVCACLRKCVNAFTSVCVCIRGGRRSPEKGVRLKCSQSMGAPAGTF